jgi:capsular polysaccharide biosynthesis protein
MREISHPQEAADIRLIYCFMKRKAWLLLAIAISGTLLFGGIYYLKYVVLGPKVSHGVSSMFYVGYSYLPYESRDFYSTAGWSEWLHSQDVLHHLVQHMGTISDVGYTANSIDFAANGVEDMYLPTIEALSSYLSVQCPENYEMITLTVTTPDPLLSMEIAKVITEIFPQLVLQNAEIGVDMVRLVDFTETSYPVVPDVRPLRAFLLGGVIFFLFTPIGYLLYASGDSKIRIPDTFERRYGIPTFSCRTQDECLALVEYLFTKGKLNAVKVGTNIPKRQVIDRLSPYMTKLWDVRELPFLSSQTSETHLTNKGNSGKKYIESNSSDRDYRNQNKAEVLLVLAAGTSRETEIEDTLQLLAEKGYRIRAALLWQEDLKLLADYYELQEVSIWQHSIRF